MGITSGALTDALMAAGTILHTKSREISYDFVFHLLVSMTAPVVLTSVDDDNNDDSRKAFLSRIPQAFNTDNIKNLLETNFGIDSISEVVIVYDRSDDASNEGGINAHRSDNATVGKLGDKQQQQHRGFGFVTFTTQEQYQTAIDSGTVRGSTSAKSHRKYTLYIRPVTRSDDSSNNNYYSGTIANDDNATTSVPKEDERNICFLWTKHRCPYGSNCKFIHVGEGGCSTTTSNGDDVVTTVTKTKKKKRNKDDDNKTTTTKEEKDKSQIDCINYKNKGKCRKGDKCPYRHDAYSLRNNKKKQQLLSKQLGEDGETSNTKEETMTTMKKRQSLSIRVFGLNYTTTEQDLHDYFTHCGKIMEITFPTYDDSGRSKGYCGVLFTSPKAVEKAVALDGSELHGRWLRIQEGKMYLKKWEEAENIRSSRKEGNERLGNTDDVNSGGDCEKGEYGQKVKRRKKHGFKDE